MTNKPGENAVPLPPAERERMRTTLIKKHDYSMIWMHWFNAFSWFLLLISGGALISAPSYRFAPEVLVEVTSAVFGGRQNLLKFHVWTGVLWIGVYLVFLAGSKRYWPIIKSVFLFDSDDLNWVKAKMLAILGRETPLPPQGFFNGGQKLFAVSVYLATPVIMLTGAVMAFQLLPPIFVRGAILLHFLAVAGVFVGLPVHIFMAGFYAPEREDFKAIFTGHISELFVYRHNYKWWKKCAAIWHHPDSGAEALGGQKNRSTLSEVESCTTPAVERT